MNVVGRLSDEGAIMRGSNANSMQVINKKETVNHLVSGSKEVTSQYDLKIKIPKENLRILRVRDYKDHFILQVLQKEAFSECPGFRFSKANWKSKVAWIKKFSTWVPAGYYVFSEESTGNTKYSNESVVFPLTLHQIYVVPELRRLGIGTQMILDFISMGDGKIVWIESPFIATKHILERLGYKETEERYELWQMMEGLSKWIRTNKPYIESIMNRKESAVRNFVGAELAYAMS